VFVHGQTRVKSTPSPLWRIALYKNKKRGARVLLRSITKHVKDQNWFFISVHPSDGWDLMTGLVRSSGKDPSLSWDARGLGVF
jgi:hypothetical protein